MFSQVRSVITTLVSLTIVVGTAVLLRLGLVLEHLR
jgi:hypothetical protein